MSRASVAARIPRLCLGRSELSPENRLLPADEAEHACVFLSLRTNLKEKEIKVEIPSLSPRTINSNGTFQGCSTLAELRKRSHHLGERDG